MKFVRFLGMRIPRGRDGALERGKLELLLIALAMFQVSLAQPVIFQYTNIGNRSPTLQVPNSPNAKIIELQNDTIICLDDFFQLNGNLVLSLPQPVGSQERADVKGRCLYKNPIQLMKSNSVTSFSTRFLVQMRSRYYTLACAGGDIFGTFQGLAFIIASDTFTQGGSRGYLGWLNSTTNAQPGHNFAVEIDFFQDKQFQDPVGVHTGIDANSLTSLRTAPLDWANVYAMDKAMPTYMTVWIEYDGLAQILKTFVGESNYQKPTTPTLTVGIDLRELLSQEGMFVGFSGSISNVTSAYRSLQNESYGFGYTIYDWTFNSDGLAPDLPRDGDGSLHYFGGTNKRQTEKIIIISVTIPAALLLLTLMLVIWKLYTRNARLTTLAKKYKIEEGLLDRGPQTFKHKVLSTATKGFSSSEVLGSGGFGSVYRGKLWLKGAQKPRDVAVKRISSASRQGVQEFLAEVKVIGQVQHRNLVRLLGWCHEMGELLLVYDYMPNGSVDRHLFKALEEEPVLTWARRLKIVSGVATALVYLHEEWEQRVIHRDVKSSNIMLDCDFNARLGDFGLARLSKHDQAPESTAVLAGTYGYLAPELAHTLKATEKTDVYSFGAMVLEVATGKRPILSFEDQKSFDEVLLVDWVWTLHRDDALLDAADCRLQNAYDPGEMIMFLKIGLLCSHPDPGERPSMREVLNIWKGSSPLPQLPPSKPTPTFISSGEDTTMTISTDVSRHSDTSGGWTLRLDSDGQSTPTIPSKDVGSSLPSEITEGRKSGSSSSTLRYRRLYTTTSLPL